MKMDGSTGMRPHCRTCFHHTNADSPTIRDAIKHLRHRTAGVAFWSAFDARCVALVVDRLEKHYPQIQPLSPERIAEIKQARRDLGLDVI